MTLCDSNVWLALALDGHSRHAPVKAWLATVTESSTLCFCRATQQSFLRLLTNPAMMLGYGNPPSTNAQAWAAYRQLLADDRVFFKADEPPGLEARWEALSSGERASPKLWMDAYLAAFALAADCRLVTCDAAFRQFPGLKLMVI